MKDLLEFYSPVLKKEILGPIIVVIVAFGLYSIISSFIKKIFKASSNKMDKRKTKTVESLFINIVKYLLILISVLVILNIYGVNASGLFASLGIISVVVGLAVQDILKDILSGISIIVENQYAVGDTVTITGFKGEVIALGLRSTKIKAYTGEIKTVANRNITEAVNHSLAKSLAVVNIPISYNADIVKVEEVLNNLCLRLKKEIPTITGDILLLGITSFDSSSINYRITAETKSMKHYEVERQILREVKIELDKNNIEIPFNQLVIHND